VHTIRRFSISIYSSMSIYQLIVSSIFTFAANKERFLSIIDKEILQVDCHACSALKKSIKRYCNSGESSFID
jgi:hypothetical protein